MQCIAKPGRAGRGPRHRTEFSVDKTDTALGALPHPVDDAQSAREGRSQYPPGAFFRAAGVIIAVCLGVGMLAQILVIMTGEY